MENEQSESEQFYFFLAERIKNGGKETAPEILLEQWRVARDRRDANEGIRRGLEDMRHSRGVELKHALDSLRSKHNRR